jgi:hypothetical protein
VRFLQDGSGEVDFEEFSEWWQMRAYPAQDRVSRQVARERGRALARPAGISVEAEELADVDDAKFVETLRTVFAQ